MKWSVPVFKIFGIQVKLHGTFLLLLGFIGLGLLMMPDTEFAVFILLQFLSIFAILLVHELSHSLVAMKFGSKVRNITLLPIGGVAQIEDIPEKPFQEILVAAAGPAVNFLFVLIIGLYIGGFNIFLEKAYEIFGFSNEHELIQPGLSEFLVFLGTFNLFIGLFNLLPGFPMDGGRILRGFLATFMRFDKATIVAVGIGQLFSLAFGVLGLLLIFEYGQIYSGIVIIVIAFFLSSSGRAEAKSVIIKTLLKDVVLETRMLKHPGLLTKDMNIQQITAFINNSYQSIYPVLDKGYLVGALYRADFMYAIQSGSINLGIPITEPIWVKPGVSFIALLTTLERKKLSSVIVTDWYGRYLGVFNTSISNSVLNEQIELQRNMSFIEQKYLFGR